MSELTRINGALYKCIVPDSASPCIEDSRFNPDLSNGTIKGRVVRKIKQLVVMGQTVPWVGVESRDQFEPANEAAERQNKADRAYLLARLKELGINEGEGDNYIPRDATLGELGKTFNRHDPRLAHVFAKHGVRQRKTRTFGLKPGAKAPQPDTDEKALLKAWLDGQGVKYHPMTGIPKLRALKEEKEEELTAPDPDDV